MGTRPNDKKAFVYRGKTLLGKATLAAAVRKGLRASPLYRRKSDPDKKGRWVTMGEGEGGSHVFIADDGTILAGPEKLEGKKIGELKREPIPSPLKNSGNNSSTSVDNGGEAGKIPSVATSGDKPKETKMDTITELPKLTGTEKQVAWAEDVRGRAFEEANKHLSSLKERFPTPSGPIAKEIEKIEAGLAFMRKSPVAASWVDYARTSKGNKVAEMIGAFLGGDGQVPTFIKAFVGANRKATA